MLINDNKKKAGVAAVGTAAGSHDMELADPADAAGRRVSMHSADGSVLSSALLHGSGLGSSGGHTNNYSAPASRHRSSFDTNAKIGSFAHTNDYMKSPYLSSFPAFRQSSFASGGEGAGFDNTNSLFSQQQSRPQPHAQLHPQPPSSNGSSMAPPLSSPSMILSSYKHGADTSNISPLSPQKSSFSDVPPLSQDMFTSPLSKPHEFSNQQGLSFSSSAGNSMGIFPNIEELALDTFDLSDKNVGDAALLAPLQNQYDQPLPTRSSLGSVWEDTANNANSMGFQVQNAGSNAYNWASPPTADFQPLRRYSYDAASATTFIPNRSTLANYDFNMNMNLATNYAKGDFNSFINNNNKGNSNGTVESTFNITSNNNNNNNNFRPMSNSSGTNSNNGSNSYSRHSSVGANTISQFNNPNHSSNIISPTKEQVIRSINDVSNYLGLPSTEVLNMEKYLSHLNTSSLPQLTYLTDAANLSNYELIACCFKNSRIDVFHISPINKQLLGEIKLGDLVIVEADRGRDLGKVVKLNVSILEARLLRYAQYLGRKAALSKEDENHKRPVLNFPKPVIRFAKNEELLTINSKINDEVRAVEVCQNKVAEYDLDMKIVDAEYQWDMKKLTFYYNSEVRIDFRDLVKELFRIYKIRIWMSKQGGIC